jgi:SAM-dependent methyltransferase
MMTEQPAPEFTSSEAARARAQEAVTNLLDGQPPPRVLEAGCGSTSRVDFGPTAHVVGMDVDPATLAKNSSLEETILGDVETYDFPADSFDAIVCWYVLEHLSQPLAALVRFAKAVRPGGVVVLAVPNVLTPKGLVTKFTPFWFHVAFKRYVQGRPNAGRPGFAPYPTTIPFAIAPEQLFAVAAAAGLDIAYAGFFEDEKQRRLRERLWVRGRLWQLLTKLVPALTGGRLDAEQTELVVVLRRTG